MIPRAALRGDAIKLTAMLALNVVDETFEDHKDIVPLATNLGVPFTFACHVLRVNELLLDWVTCTSLAIWARGCLPGILDGC